MMLAFLAVSLAFAASAHPHNGNAWAITKRQSIPGLGGIFEALGVQGTAGLDAFAPIWGLIQQGFGALGSSMDRMGRNVKSETLVPQLRQNAKRERLWFGPFNLPGFGANSASKRPLLPLQMDPASVQINYPINGFCKNCTVLYGKAALYFGNGTKASVEHGVYEHHVVVVDLGKPRNVPFYLCQGQSGFLGTFPGNGFIVSGNDEASNMFTTPDGSFNSGYVVRTPRLAMQAELVNYRPEAQKVYVTMEYEYLPTTPTPAPADTSVSLFSVTGCRFPDYHRPPDQKIYNMSSAEVPVPMDGYIINAKGHLHDGGDHIILTLNGKPICDSHAIYGNEIGADSQQWAVIRKMEQCTTPVPVQKGAMLQMLSFYDTEKYPPRPTQGHGHGEMAQADEMGVYFINFAVTPKG